MGWQGPFPVTLRDRECTGPGSLMIRGRDFLGPGALGA
jgi:hypothetical protein